MDEEELAGFITGDPLAWRTWMAGCERGRSHGHQDERAGMEALADLVPRRQLVLKHCREETRMERANTMTTAEVRQARSGTRGVGYTGGPIPWEKEGTP